MYAVLQHNAANETQAPSAFPVSAAMSNYCTTARQGAKNDRDYGARHPVLRDSIVLHHGCVLAYGQRAPRAPHRKCRRIGGRYFNREKSGDVAPAYPGSYRPRIRTGYVAFFKKLLGSPAGFGFARSAAEFEWRNRRTRILLTRGGIALLRPPARQRFSLGPNTLALIHACGAIHSLRPRNRWPGRSDAAACTCATCFLQSAQW